MIGGKVVVTYKRKRPSSRTDFCHENDLPNKPAECTISNTSTASNKNEESTEDDKSENQKKDSGVCVELVVSGIGSEILHSDDGYHPSHAQCIDSPEDVTEGKRLCSGCMKENNTLLSFDAQNFNGIKDEHLSENSDTNKSAFGSCSHLERSPVGNGCQNNPGGAFAKDSHAVENLVDDQGGPCSCINSGSVHEHYCTMKCSFSPLVKPNCGTDPDLDGLKSSSEKENSIELVATSASRTVNLERTDSTLKDKSRSSGINVIAENKLTSPLITFRRRSKRVKDVNGPDSQSNSQGGEYCALTLEGSEPAIIVNASAFEASGICSVDLSINDMHSVEHANTRHSIAGAQEKKCSQSLDCTAPAGSAPENNAAIQEEEQAHFSRHGVKDSPPIVEGRVSECPSNDGLNTASKACDGIGSNGGSVASGDLSIPPPDSQFVVDCNIALASDSDEQPIHNSSQVLGKSMDSTCRSALLEVSPRDKGLNLSTEGITNTLSSEKAQLPGQEGSYVRTIDNEGNDCLKVSPMVTGMTSKNNYLQLFPEDRSNGMSPIGKALQKVIDCKDPEERNGHAMESCTEPNPPSIKSPLCLGRSLLMEPTVEVYAHNSAFSQFPNVRFQSKEFIPDSVSPSFSDQTLSLLRHQMMLDNIVNRARGLKGDRSSCLDQFETPNLWLEEELDSLWVGVRRHGRGNWEGMLRDPRLHFLSWRTPRDLAEKWQEEMRKLFNNMPVSHMNCLKTPEHLLLDRLNGLFRSKSGKENLVDDVKLSLGEVYSRPMDGFQNRSMFKYTNVQDDVHNQLQKPVSNARSYPSSRAIRGRRMFSHWEGKAMLTSISSPNADPTNKVAVNGNLPHWLKEAVSIPPMPHDPSLLSLASSASCSSMQSSDQPNLESVGTHPELRKRLNGAHATSRIELQIAGRAHLGNFPQVTRHGKDESRQYHVDKQQNLIIIDSDASSEETISDDHSGRP